ncbi:MAG: alpha/beta hydrolase [Chlorobiales bacterium]|nr:alpha/beta hydrolase [Chlorobiales bacterium]
MLPARNKHITIASLSKNFLLLKSLLLWLAPLILAGCGTSDSSSKSMFTIPAKDHAVYEQLLAEPETKIRYIKSFDLTTLACREVWPENPDDVRSILVFIHGTATQSRLYLPLADTLKKNNIATVLLDLRGHGLSGGERGDVPSIDALVRDVRITLDSIRNAYPGKKIILGGHSLGAGLCLKFVEFFSSRKKLYTPPDAMILMSGGFLMSKDCDSSEASRLRDYQNGRSFAKIDAMDIALYFPAGYFGIHPKSIEVLLPTEDSAVARAVKQGLFTTKYSVQFFLASFPFEPRLTYRKLKFPVLLVAGKQDELMRTCDAIYSYEKLHEPNKELFLVSEANHTNIIWLSAGAIAEWINGLETEMDSN